MNNGSIRADVFTGWFVIHVFLFQMKFYLLFIFLFLSLRPCVAMEVSYRFRVYLKDKGECGLRLEEPTKFLSVRAIERRERQKIAIEESDLPISSDYKKLLEAAGGDIITESKWLKTIVVENKDSLLIDRLRSLSIVDSVKFVWKGMASIEINESDKEQIIVREKKERGLYGYAMQQLKMLKGDKLHKKGFKGKNIQIAVIDAGFANVDRINAFKSAEVLGTYNVSQPDKSVYDCDEHGTKVLSCLTSDIPEVMVGSAPSAGYWLIKSEETETEFPIEEDYWAAAAEFADSVGVDIISSSLGYFSFDDSTLNYSPGALDGKRALISKAATMAAEKGLLVFSSAGNEGDSPWRKITVPADAEKIITVGAVMADGKQCSFSSYGFTADGRIKPDVVSLGSGCAVIDSEGKLRFVSGTSFSTPILAGLGACLWQALPSLTAKEIRQLIRRYASLYKEPNAGMGYGIPDFYKSYKKGLKYVSQRNK